MVRMRYTLDEFIHDMSALVASQPDQAALFDRGTAYLEQLTRNPEAIPEQFRRGSGRGRRPAHGSYVLHRGPGLLVTTVIWGPGEHVGPHDHHTWGMIGVLDNGIEESRFRRVDEGDRDGYARLERQRTTRVHAGEVSLLVPDVDEIHALDNASDRAAVEVHIYGADLVGLERCQYDVETGEVRRLVSGRFDNC